MHFPPKNDDPTIKESFVAIRAWCEKFMRRHEFSLRRKTTAAQKDPLYMVDRIDDRIGDARPSNPKAIQFSRWRHFCDGRNICLERYGVQYHC